MQFISHCEKIIDCSFGEPFTHPNFIDLIKETAGKGQRFGFSTNGLLLTQSKADTLAQYGKYIDFSVSVNASNSETYYKLTGQNFEKLIENLTYFIKKHKEKFPENIPPITLSLIVMKINREEVFDFIRLANSLGVWGVCLRHLFNVLGKEKTRNDFGFNFIYEKEILTPAEYNEIGGEAKKLAHKLGLNITILWKSSESEIRNLSEPDVDIPCLFPWKFLFVQEHSKNVYVCCYTNMSVASLTKKTLDEIWNGEALKEIRYSLVDDKLPQFCIEHGNNCPLVAERMVNNKKNY
jgi:MoaA/NifB/PqqE/SkfB family radical SAM enzyme